LQVATLPVPSSNLRYCLTQLVTMSALMGPNFLFIWYTADDPGPFHDLWRFGLAPRGAREEAVHQHLRRRGSLRRLML